ncbi:metalloprotease-like protein [Beauveria bassiana ARSEF 2860]|uniref:Metalloprotease-like protein n=1 Tax=Beauveria bassiana (strain ARSEF 2860) TaxID=655819 RepID=J4KM44_BEAB2|nr:metalloprotease-like protein [Beauveria bassiana ARSEF 2860]EJP63309.1 metalloprotease-like protein [Beauveria bassiana ARSEF 2860]
MATDSEKLLQRIKGLEQEIAQARREKEQTQSLLRDTTLQEYLRGCQELVLSKVHLVTDGYLTTKAPLNNPTRKHCPTLLVPWDDFIPAQTDVFQQIDRIFPHDERLFESLHFLEVMGNRIDACRVRDEASLVSVQQNTIEVPVRIIMSKINDFDPQRYSLAVPEEKDIAFIIEYKAIHKLHTAHFDQGLQQMNILEEAVNKMTLPTAEPERVKHYAELLSAAAVTQTYHYMLEAGLEYGYLTNGDAIVFLNIDWTDPTVLRYHLARPAREVLVDQDATWSNAVCQVLAFTIMALQSSQHSNDERVAANKCNKWLVDFGHVLDQILKEEEEREKKAAHSGPTTSIA